MGKDMSITYDDMRNSAKDLADGHAEIEGKLAHLKNGIDNLVGAGFVTGAASPQFQESYHEFNTGVSKVLEGLQGMSKFLTSAADAYEQTDAQLAQALNKG